MAGIFVHLVIAREIIKQLPQGTIKDEGLFYAGSIAPDAIHSRAGFVRADKKHTHLRDDILDSELEKADNLSLFHKRVTDFIFEHRDRENLLWDFYRGYVVHILTDELFVLTVRREFSEAMKQLGLIDRDQKYYEYILTDINRNDLFISANYKEKQEIKEKLRQVGPHYLEGYLSEEELRNSLNWAYHRYFCEEHILLEPVYMSHESILTFIDMATRNIIERLSEGESLPRIF